MHVGRLPLTKPYTHEDANTGAEIQRWHAAAARELSANLPKDLALRLQDVARNLEAHAAMLEGRYVALARRSRVSILPLG